MKFYIYVMVLWTVGLLLARLYLADDIRRHFGPSLIASYAFIAMAALVVDSPPLFFGLCFLCFFIGVRTPLDAGCRFLLLTAMVPHISLRISPGGMYVMDLQPIKVFAVAFAIVCLAHGRRSRGAPWRLSSEALALIAFTVVTTFGAYRELSVTSFARQLASVLLFLLPFLLLRQQCSKREDVRVLMGVLAGVGAVLAVIAVYEALRGWSLFDPAWMRLDEGDVMTRNLRVRGGLMRSPVTFAESTSFAVFQLAATVVALFARHSFRSTTRWLLCCGQIGIGLLCAQSRGAIIGLLVAVIAAFVVKRAYGKAASVAITAMAAVTILLSLARTNSQISGFLQADAALRGTDYRQRLFTRGLEVGFRHPWFGSDLTPLRVALADMKQGENIVDFVNAYLSLFLTGGLVGLAAIFIPLAWTYFKLWRPLGASADAGASTQQACAVAMLTGVLTALAFTSLWERNPFWLLLALTFAKTASLPVPKVKRVASHLAPAY